MDDNFSPRVKDVISFSKEEALRLGHDYIGTEHLMLGILRDGGGKAIFILNSIDVDLEGLRRKVEILNPSIIEDSNIESTKNNLHLTRQAERALKTTFLEAKLFQSDLINTVHLLLCILRNENDPTTKLLINLNVNYDLVKEQFKLMLTNDIDYINLPSSSSFPEEKDEESSTEKENSFIRFRWEEDEYKDTYFEFLIQIDEMTRDVSLMITDYAEDETEQEEQTALWQAQFNNLKRALGS